MTSFYLSYEQREYWETWLSRVSRSFALVTPCFEEPLDAYMSIAYLLCRVADNIEDCYQPYEWQQARFAEFKQLLQNPELAPSILANWLHEDWLGLDANQTRLMQPDDGLMLWQIYTLIPNPSRSIICHWISVMVEGMEKILDTQQEPLLLERHNIRLLATENDCNQYCYYVAGTVGHMGTDLAIAHYQFNPEVATQLLEGCESCGRALQKTNIIKDFVEDLGRGFCYLPDAWIAEADGLPLLLQGAPRSWMKMVLDRVMSELNASVTYVTSIPYESPGYRLASLLCLLPAYQTILLAAQQHEIVYA
ncbi:MAG: squalene/phytoene synthase family protein [Pseudanabaena sp. SU_2_4]|nr:squalene/phytoene synthase family protein [Pseudanabaena sp. SU_2_4]